MGVGGGGGGGGMEKKMSADACVLLRSVGFEEKKEVRIRGE